MEFRSFAVLGALLMLSTSPGCDGESDPAPPSTAAAATPPHPHEAAAAPPPSEPEPMTCEKTVGRWVRPTVAVVPTDDDPALILVEAGEEPPVRDFEDCERLVALDLATGKVERREIFPQSKHGSKDRWLVADNFIHEGRQYAWMRRYQSVVLYDLSRLESVFVLDDAGLKPLAPKLVGAVAKWSVVESTLFVLANDGHIWALDPVAGTAEQGVPAPKNLDDKWYSKDGSRAFEASCHAGTSALVFAGPRGSVGVTTTGCPRCQLQFGRSKITTADVFLAPQIGVVQDGKRRRAVGTSASGECGNSWGDDPPRLVLHHETVSPRSAITISRIDDTGATMWSSAQGTDHVEGVRLTPDLAIVRRNLRISGAAFSQLHAIELDTGKTRWVYPNDSRAESPAME